MTLPAVLQPVAPLDPSILTMAWFLAGMLLLDYFDIALPRGDSAGVTGALSAAAILVLGWPYAIGIAMTSTAVSHLVRRREEGVQRVFAVATTRVLSLGATSALLWLPVVRSAPLIQDVLVPGAALVLDLLIAQALLALASGRPLLRLVRGNLNSQAPLVAAQWSASVLLLVTYDHMGRWGLIPVIALLLLMRQSYALFLDVRQTYRATVEVLVEAAESQDDRRSGHAERTAMLARAVATKIGLPAAEVERISYAALLHDLGELSEGSESQDSAASAADVVRGVKFFAQVEPILRVFDDTTGQVAHGQNDLLAALIVSLASDIDCEYHPQVGAAHRGGLLDSVSHQVSAEVKARAVGAALRLGYRIPAVG